MQSSRWRRWPKAVPTVRRAIATAAKAVSTPRAGLAIVLGDDSAIRALNWQWRGLDAPTNVLSFPAAAGAAADGVIYLGDIVIACETVAREAQAEGKPVMHHLAHLAVHGFLHLIGYDHDTDRKARRMERLEAEILGTLRIPDPYARPVTV